MTLKMVIDGDTPEMDGQQDPKGSFGDRGSPILAETYAVVQMKMIRNPPLIHQGFIGYDAISQNIRKPGFCTLEGPQRDGIEGISSHPVARHSKVIGHTTCRRPAGSRAKASTKVYSGCWKRWTNTLPSDGRLGVPRDKPNGNGRLREDIPKVITDLLWFVSDLHRIATCYHLHQIGGHDMHVQSWIVAPWVVSMNFKERNQGFQRIRYRMARPWWPWADYAGSTSTSGETLRWRLSEIPVMEYHSNLRASTTFDWDPEPFAVSIS